MARSLKERYATQQLTLVRERVQRAETSFINENTVAQLLVEAMDEEDLNKVASIVKKLSTLKSPQLPSLTAGIEQAETELNKYTAGGPITKAWTKMKGLIGIDNPIVKVTTFANALERGFSQVPLILKNNGIDLKDADKTKSLATILGTKATTGKKSDAELGNERYSKTDKNQSVQNEADGNTEAKLKSIVDQLKKALSPGGIFGAFKKVPYVNGDELAQELVSAPLNVFADVVKKIQQGAKAAEIGKDIEAQVTGKGNVETKGTKQSEPSKQTTQTEPSQPTTNSTTTTKTTPTGETPATPGTENPSTQAAQRAKVKIVKLLGALKKNPKNINSFVKSLMDAGLDPERLG